MRLARKNPQQAIGRLQELRWGYPAFPARRKALLLPADTYFSLGEYGAAAELYRPLAEAAGVRDPRPVHDSLARHHHMGQYSAALQMYRRLLGEEVEVAARDSIYFDQAVLLVRMGQEDEAVRQFLLVRDEFPEAPLASQAGARAGHIAFALKQYDQARRIYQPLLERDVSDSLVYGQYALALFRLQRIEEGRKAAKRYADRMGENRSGTSASCWRKVAITSEQKITTERKAFRDVVKRRGVPPERGVITQKPSGSKSGRAQRRARRAWKARALCAGLPRQPSEADAYLRLANYQFALHNYLQAGAYKRVWRHQRRRGRGAKPYGTAAKSGRARIRSGARHCRTATARLPRPPRQLEARLSWCYTQRRTCARHRPL